MNPFLGYYNMREFRMQTFPCSFFKREIKNLHSHVYNIYNSLLS